jgi:hypothetical protein
VPALAYPSKIGGVRRENAVVVRHISAALDLQLKRNYKMNKDKQISDWKGKALEKLPELRNRISNLNEIENPMALWVEISFLIQTAMKCKDEGLVKRVFDLAEWFVKDGPRSSKAEKDSMSSVCISFYEHLPTFENAGYFISRYIPKEYFIANKRIFIHLINENQFSNILNEYKKKDLTTR